MRRKKVPHTQHWTFCLRQISDMILSGNGTMYIHAIHLDTLPRHRIWSSLDNRGTTKELLNVAKSIYCNTKNIITTERR